MKRQLPNQSSAADRIGRVPSNQQRGRERVAQNNASMMEGNNRASLQGNGGSMLANASAVSSSLNKELSPLPVQPKKVVAKAHNLRA